MAFLYPWKGSSVAIRAPARKSSPRSASQFLRTVPDLPGIRSTQAGRGMILPTCQVHDASVFTWTPTASVLVMPHMLINPQHPHTRETGRGHQMRLAGGLGAPSPQPPGASPTCSPTSRPHRRAGRMGRPQPRPWISRGRSATRSP